MSNNSQGTRRRRRAEKTKNRPLRWVGGSVLGLAVAFGAAMGIDTALNGDDVPRGAIVGGVEIGGLEPAAARERLAAELGDRATEPVTVRAGDRESTFVPAESGLAPDWAATVDAAGHRSLNPVAWVRGFFATDDSIFYYK